MNIALEWGEAGIAAHPEAQGALLAGPRSADTPSLSPSSLQKLEAGTRLVLPSPNGATLSLCSGSTPTLTAGLRNARAVAQWIEQQGVQHVCLIPAGERWPDGSLCPALEDWLGAGAVLQAFETGVLAAEAELARANFTAVQARASELILNSVSGQELETRHFVQDVHLACAWNVSTQVPYFERGRYRPV